MPIRTSLGPWTTALFTTLGLAPLVACGGTVIERSERAQTGGAGGASGGSGASAGGLPAGGGGYYSAGGYFGGDGAWGAGGASTGGVEGLLPQCQNPSPLLGPDGKPTGFVNCASGAIQRMEKRDCVTSVPRAGRCPGAMSYDGGPEPGGCLTDGDCSGPHAYCAPISGGPIGCYCAAGCASDAECENGQICLCGDPIGQCVSARCTANGDCPGGALCLSYVIGAGCSGMTFACQASGDTCGGDADCPSGWRCELAATGGRSCVEGMVRCVSGRPFLVGSAARIADVTRRRDWSSSLAPCLDELDQAARDALAAHWTEVALMEHASIAAFARFALEIMSLGAPPELLVGTHEAMADETVHARDAFALASAYASRPIGPGKLDVGAALSSRSPLDVVRTAILEGCIGETVAAVEAAEALGHATDPAVREALTRVTTDETRHAELAWRFVKWVLTHADARLRMETARELSTLVESERAAQGASTGAETHPPDATVAAHGAISAVMRGEIRRRVIEEIVLPCAHALVNQSQRFEPSNYFAPSGELMKNST